MNEAHPKFAVLKALEKAQMPLGLAQLMNKLGPGFKDRTVRRWLSDFVEAGQLHKNGQGRATKYELIKEIEKDQSYPFSAESLQVIEKTKRPIFERTPCAYDEIFLKAYEPNQTSYIPALTREKLEKLGRRFSDHDPAGTYAHQIFNRLLIDLSYNSSRLEGNTYSLLDTERLLLSGEDAQGKLDEEKIMILNHKEAIRYLVENAARIQVTEKTILTLHYLLSDGLIQPKYSGKLRDHWVRVSGSVYLPDEDIPRLKRRFKAIAAKANAIENPFEQSLFLLVHLSYLQAFSDVNKRCARIAANIPLICHNFVPLSFNDVDRDDYMSAMIAIYEQKDVRPICDLFVFSYSRTCLTYDATIEAFGFDEIRVRYRLERRQIIREIIIHKLIDSKMEKYISDSATKVVPKKDRREFIQDVHEDLQQIDVNRLAGLGITQKQLSDWKKHDGSQI